MVTELDFPLKGFGSKPSLYHPLGNLLERQTTHLQRPKELL